MWRKSDKFKTDDTLLEKSGGMVKQKTKVLLKFLVVFSVCVIAGVRYFSLERVNPLDGADHYYSDQITYNFLAGQLLHDRIYAEEGPPATRYRAWRPPGYPIFLALLLWLGQNNLQFVISAQYILLLFMGISVFYLGSKTSHSFFGGLLSCIALYSFAPISHFASLVMSETLFMFGICFFLIFLYAGLRTTRVVYYICAGCLLGLSTLVRTVTLPFLSVGILLLIVGWIVLKTSKHVVMMKNLSILIVCAWLTVLPMTLRNYLVFHAFVPVATADGMNFYMGTKSPFDFTYEHNKVVVPLRKIFGEVDCRNELVKLGLKTIYLHPGKYLLHKIKTIKEYIMPYLRIPNLHYISLNSFFQYTYTENIERISHVLFWIGCFVLVVRRDLWSWVFLLFYGGIVTSSSLAFLSDSRFVIVTLPLYFIICACGVIGLLNSARRAVGKLFQRVSSSY